MRSSNWLKAGALAAAVSTSALAGAPTPPPAASAPGKQAPAKKASDVQVFTLPKFTLKNGATLNNVKTACLIRGTLNDTKDNAVIGFERLAGTVHDYDYLVGAGKALDPAKYFIVTCNSLGNPGATDNPTTNPTTSGMKMNFPHYSFQDVVEVQYRILTEQLGVKRVALAFGSSLGAMKTFELAVAHPDFVKAIVPITGSAKVNAQMRWAIDNSMSSVAAWSGWQNGNYKSNDPKAVSPAVLDLLPMWIDSNYFEANMSPAAKYDGQRAFWKDLFDTKSKQDARSYYYQLEAWKNYDVSDRPEFQGDLKKALASIKAKTFLMSEKTDPSITESEWEVAAKNIPGAKRIPLNSAMGHLACCGFDPGATAITEKALAQALAEK